MEFWAIIIGIVVVVWSIGKVAGYLQQRPITRAARVKERIDKVEEAEQELEAIRIQTKRDRRAIEEGKRKLEAARKRNRLELENLAREKSIGFPWLAEAYADYLHLQDLKTASYLQHKRRPARKAAENVREIASKRRIAEKLHRVLRYQLEYYENLFPWLVEFKSEDIEDLVIQTLDQARKDRDHDEVPDDPAKQWLTAAEYEELSRIEKYQLALDRYWRRRKSKWQIGRDYERYIGYLYEESGWNVYYQGIIKGLEDLGRDLIARKADSIQIIQCKCWSQRKTIHEKHVFQLFGTTIEFLLKNMESKDSIQPSLFPELLNEQKVKATFITSTTLSEKAKEFAEVLQVQVREDFPFQPYPSIKCNISRQNGAKIYHLPFDQQYDRTIVEKERNECYVETVKEAEELGFRRAFRWKGESPE